MDADGALRHKLLINIDGHRDQNQVMSDPHFQAKTALIMAPGRRWVERPGCASRVTGGMLIIYVARLRWHYAQTRCNDRWAKSEEERTFFVNRKKQETFFVWTALVSPLGAMNKSLFVRRSEDEAAS
jgi:hypothetical protein